MPHLYLNEESDYSVENTCGNEIFRFTILHHRKKLNRFTPQLQIYYVQLPSIGANAKATTGVILWKMVFFKISQNLQESSVTFPKCLITPFYRTTPDERSYRNRLSLMKRCGCNAYCFGQIRLLVKRVSVIHLVDEFFFCFLV